MGADQGNVPPGRKVQGGEPRRAVATLRNVQHAHRAVRAFKAFRTALQLETTGYMTPTFAWALLLVLPLPGLIREARATQSPPDSLVYHVDPSSRLVVKTGKAGLFGFAGHTHVIRARAVSGELVYGLAPKLVPAFGESALGLP